MAEKDHKDTIYIPNLIGGGCEHCAGSIMMHTFISWLRKKHGWIDRQIEKYSVNMKCAQENQVETRETGSIDYSKMIDFCKAKLELLESFKEQLENRE